MRSALEGLPGVEEVAYLPEGDRFVVNYRGKGARGEEFARAVLETVVAPGIRRRLGRKETGN